MGQLISASYGTSKVGLTEAGESISKMAPSWCWLSHGSSAGTVSWGPLSFATWVFPLDLFPQSMAAGFQREEAGAY